MFLWVEVPGGIDTQSLFDECIRQSLQSPLCPGEPFYPKDAPAGKFRLNFSNTPADQIEVEHPTFSGGHGRYTGLNTEN